jgi:translation initiation factor IF-3
VAPNANPPVCRIMDYGKFKFDEAQRAKESRRKTTSTSIKEMKYRPKIGIGDFDTKTRQVQRFLTEGHKVKITIMFRGREMSHPELGKKILDNVAEKVAPAAKVEAAPKLDGRNMIMVLAPDRRAQQAAQANRVPGHDTESGHAESGPATDIPQPAQVRAQPPTLPLPPPAQAQPPTLPLPPVQAQPPVSVPSAQPVRSAQPAQPVRSAQPAPSTAQLAGTAATTNGRAVPVPDQAGVRQPAPAATAPEAGAGTSDNQES